MCAVVRCLLREVCDVEMLGNLLDHPLSEFGVSLRIKQSPPEIGGDFTLVIGFGVLRTGDGSETNGIRSSCRQR